MTEEPGVRSQIEAMKSQEEPGGARTMPALIPLAAPEPLMYPSQDPGELY